MKPPATHTSSVSKLGAALLGLALGVTACDSGPEGPGVLIASVHGESLGGVLIEVTGRGIQGFEGLGDTRVYEAPVPSVPDTHRVILIGREGGELRFEIEVDDVGMAGPAITVVSAAGVDNLARLASDIEARIERPGA